MMMRLVLRSLIFGSVLVVCLADFAAACGPDTDCRVGDRSYRIRMPADHDGVMPVGAIVFAHGYRGSAAGIMASDSLAAVASELGVALIAAKSAGDDWSIPGAPSLGSIDGIDELAYFDAMLEDAGKRFPIDQDSLMATGFSAGGMMVWNLACHRSLRFAAFAPISGTFWVPLPETCERPVASIIHIHGDADPIVPLAGREVDDARQGDVEAALAMYAEFGRFGPAASRNRGGLRCLHRMNEAGDALGFCKYSGGHVFDAAFVDTAWRAFVEAGKL